MKIRARGIDPITGEADPHGIPQIACPARRDDVNPQFTCRVCPFAAEVEEHQAVDDLGAPFYMIDAVECTFDGEPVRLPASWQRFPNPFGRKAEPPLPLVEPGVPCPLLTWPERSAPVTLESDGARWVPVGTCRTCQFCRGVEGERIPGSPGAGAGVGVICTAPVYSPPPAPEEGVLTDERELPRQDDLSPGGAVQD